PAVLLISALVTPALAQRAPLPFRGTIEFGGDYRGAPPTIRATSSPTINAEPATLSTSHKVAAAPGVRAGVSWQVWKQLAAGVTISRSSSSVDGSVTATVAHPFSFNRPRHTESAISGLSRKDLLIAAQVRGRFPVSRRVVASVFAGPVWASVTQSVITSIDYSESYPYDSIEFRSAQTARAAKKTMTFGGGADLAYFFMNRVGVGAGIAYAGGRIELPAIGGRTVKTNVGGVDANVGVRVRF
ncbi:MAG TPA: hypothetical protein VEA16_05195, partial [Vicinamibacterales bacterium]|nr:hypothetical protein [Vicinamibacterales bacterium]